MTLHKMAVRKPPNGRGWSELNADLFESGLCVPPTDQPSDAAPQLPIWAGKLGASPALRLVPSRHIHCTKML